MDEKVSVFSQLNDEVSVSYNQNKKIEKDGYFLLLSPETGAWLTVTKQDMEVLDLLHGTHEVGQLRKIKDSRVGAYFDELFYSGLLRINGKDVFMVNTKTKEEGPELPLFWVLKYTTACNLRCAYCYSFDKKQSKRVDLSNDYIYRISDLVGETKEGNRLCLCFHGGEPLIRINEMKACVKELRKRRKEDVEFTIQTNGTLLTRDVAKFLKEEDVSVGISVDGFDANTNKLRLFANHHSSITKTLDAINNCVEVGIRPGIISVMTNAIKDHTIEIINHLSELGVKYFHFNHFIPSGRGENKMDDFSISTEELLNIRTEILLHINDYNSHRIRSEHINERFTRNIIKRLISTNQLSYMCAQSPCGAGRKILTLNTNGDVFPCDDLGTCPKFKIGHINEIVNLKETLDTSAIVNMCQSHCVNNIQKCRECLYKKLCISHCCSDSYHYSGQFNNPHSACEFIQQFIPLVIDLLYKGRIQVENLID